MEYTFTVTINGQQIRQTVTAATEAEARQLLAAVLFQQYGQDIPDSSIEKVSEAVAGNSARSAQVPATTDPFDPAQRTPQPQGGGGDPRQDYPFFNRTTGPYPNFRLEGTGDKLPARRASSEHRAP